MEFVLEGSLTILLFLCVYFGDVLVRVGIKGYMSS